MHQFGVYLYAYPANGVYGPKFEGFYLDSGELISHGWYSESEGAYVYFYGEGKGSELWPSGSTVIARFSDELPYNAHDFEKCRAFLEQTDANGVKNGDKISENYDPNDPETWGRSSWGTERFQWTAVNGEKRVSSIYVSYSELFGRLDLSGCIALEYLSCFNNSLTELDVTDCTALEYLYCRNNNLNELDVTQNTALRRLNCNNNNLNELDVTQNTALEGLLCDGNSLTELDVTQNTALEQLWCDGNSLTELDVTQNTALEELRCSGNSLTELDVSNCIELWLLGCSNNGLTELDLSNQWMPFDYVRSHGNGNIGYQYLPWPYDDSNELIISAYPSNYAQFEGFYNENGELISYGSWNENYGAYIYYNRYAFTEAGLEGELETGTIIARFSGGYTPGDLDGNGSVTVADAIMALRLAMGLLDGSGLNTDAADMDGNGSITLADAILILRTAMGLS